MENAQNPWSVPVVVEDIPETGLHLAVEASPEVRAQIEKLAGLRELPQLSAVFDLTRRGAGVHVIGQVKARVGQTCVVTLEPIESVLEESVDLVFAPQQAGVGKAEDGDHRASEEDPPEALLGGKVDLGAIATEFLLLGINPYPRKAGVKFPAIKADEDRARPFASLEALKKRLGG